MIPLRDNIPYRTFPFINYSIIAACAVVFLLQLGDAPGDEASLVYRYGMIPVLVQHPNEPVVVQEPYLDRERGKVIVVEREIKPVIAPWLTLFTCIFLHGGWMHFLGNMWFLHIFGDNVEDRLGHIGYLIFYLAAGVLASVAHLLTNSESSVPTIGASGAIAGVMGAYFLLYPKAKVESIVPVFGFIQLMTLPAAYFLGLWFLMQLLQGAVVATGTTGVAWWAHIGGFIVGILVASLLRLFGQTTPPVQQRLSHRDTLRVYEYPR